MNETKTEQTRAGRFQSFIDNYKQGHVVINDKVEYNLLDVINENVRLKSGKFDEPLDARGKEKVNMGHKVGHIMKGTLYRSTDIDTRDLQMRALTEKATKLSPLFKAALKDYLKTTNYGTEMNRHRSEFLDGHLMVKEVDNETKIVNLANIVRPPHIMDIQDGGCADPDFYTWEQMLSHKEEWEDSWSDVEKIKERLDAEGKVNQFVVWEWWLIDKFKVNGVEKETKGCVKFLDFDYLDEKNPLGNNCHYLELDSFPAPNDKRIKSKRKLKGLQKQGYLNEGEDSLPMYPYKERRFLTVEGRYLGVGVWELLAGIMEVYSDSWINKRNFDELANKGVMVLRKGSGNDTQSITQDFMDNLQTGALLETENDEELYRLPMGSITAEHLNTVEKLFEIARQTMGITASFAGGEESTQSATEAAINQQNAKTTYATVIEEMSLFYTELFEDFKLKEIIEEMDAEDYTKITGTEAELQELEAQFIDNLVNVKVKEAADTRSFIPDESELTEEKQKKIVTAVETARKEQGEVRFAELSKKLIQTVEYQIEFFVNNEAFDKNLQMQELNGLIQEARSNPLSEFSADKIMEEKMDLMDLNPNRYKKSIEEKERDAKMVQDQQQEEAGLPDTSLPQEEIAPV